LQVPIREAMRAQVFAPSVEPAKSAFFLVRGIVNPGAKWGSFSE